MSALVNVLECSGLKPFLFHIMSFTKLTMLALGMVDPSKTNCPLLFQLIMSGGPLVSESVILHDFALFWEQSQ